MQYDNTHLTFSGDKGESSEHDALFLRGYLEEISNWQKSPIEFYWEIQSNFMAVVKEMAEINVE